MRNPDLFSREINYQVLSNSEFNRILHRHSRLTSCGEFTLPRRPEAGALRSPAPRRGRCLNLSESQSRPPNQRTTNETRCSGESAMAILLSFAIGYAAEYSHSIVVAVSLHAYVDLLL